MSEMIERVARAVLSAQLAHEDDSTKPHGWDDAHQTDRDLALSLARAAIEAMREPSEAMREAAWRVYEEKDRRRMAITGGLGDVGDDGWETHYWQAMIDAALGPVQDETARKGTG